jgi:hypothetical protein
MTLEKSRFNIDPYYDDFDETKKFLQILFKPGYSIQARELTQLQSILSNQMGRFADHMFEEGDVIQGGGITERKLKFVRLESGTTTDIDELVGYNLKYTHTVSDTSEGLEDDVLTGTETEIIGKVIFALDSTSGDPYKILFIDILQGSQDENSEFSAGQENITTTNPNINPTLKIKDANSVGDSTGSSTGEAIVISIEQGLFYVNGYFVMSTAQSIAAFETESLVRKFTPENRTLSIGFSVNREIETSTTDVTLRDPSQGSYNYNAPGSDRYKIDLVISQIPYIFDEQGYRTDFDTDNYFEFARIIKGQTFKTLKYPEYAQLEETLARRTYDESGHYTVRPFGIETIDYNEVWDPAVTGRTDHYNYLAVGLQTGKAYVRGYEFELQNTEHLVAKKARTTIKQNDRTIDIDFGNYVLVEHNIDGTTPLFQLDGAMNENNMNLVGGDAIPEYKKVNLSIVGSIGEMTPIGCARIFQIAPHAYDQGTLGVGTTYRVYLNDIVFGSDAGLPASADLMTMHDVAYISDPISGKKLFKLYIKSGNEKNDGLYSKGQTSLLFRVPVGNTVKEVTGLDYYAQRDFMFDLTESGGTWSGTISAPAGTNWQGSGDINDITNIDEYMVAVDGYIFNMNPASTGDYGGNNLVADSSSTSLTVNLISTATNTWSGTKKGYLLANIRINADDEIVGGESSTIRKKILKRHTVNIANNNNADGTSTMWNSTLANGWGINLGYSDIFMLEKVEEIGTGNNITNDFSLNNGQTRHLYDHGSIVLDSGSVGGTGGVENSWAQPGAGFKVTFLYFDHQTFDGGLDSTDYTTLKYPCVVNSYIHNEHEVTEFDNGGVTAEFGKVGGDIPAELSAYNYIPMFSDDKVGQTLELNDAIDFRPIKVGGWDTSHAESGKIRGVWTPQDGKLFFCDYESYLPRIDKLVLTKDREFKILEGVPSLTPFPPEHNPNDMMVLYELNWNPYTFNADDVSVEYQDNQRYTMEMIGELDNRIKELERTTTLSANELETKIEAKSHGDKFINVMASEGFTTLLSSSVESAEHNVSFDREKGLMHPAQSFTNINLNVHKSKSLPDGITSSGDNIYTLTPTSTTVSTVNNLTGNIVLYPNPFSKTNWVGNLKLSPSSDDWFDVTKSPKIISNEDSSNDTYLLAVKRKTKGMNRWAWGIPWIAGWLHHQPRHKSYDDFGGFKKWNSMKNINNSTITGTKIYKKHFNNYKKACTNSGGGINCAVWMTANHSKLKDRGYFSGSKQGNKVVDNSIKNKVRAKEVTLTSVNMKPNTRYWVFIDGKKITETVSKYGYIKSSDNSMRTNSNGSASCVVQIPENNPYYSGSILFRMTDSKTNVASLATTTSESFFVVRGNVKSSEGIINCTREITAKRDSANNERITQDSLSNAKGQVLSDVADYFDSMAQIIEIDSTQYPKGVFATSVDLFFRDLDSGNLPFSVELRPLINDAPHPTTPIPLSDVTKTSGFTSNKNGPDTSSPTRFEFSSPVFLESGRYALMIKTNSTKYTLWGTEFGKKGLTADGSATSSDVEKQPYVGSLYLPQNNGSRYKNTNQNAMFRLNRATYTINSENTMHLQGATADTINADNEVVSTPDYHTVTLSTEYISDPVTSLKYYMKDGTNSVQVLSNDITELSKRKTFDLGNQTATDESISEVIMSTSDANITPVVDMDRLSMVVAKNEMSSDLSKELLPDAPTSSTPVARYIGKIINTGNEANYVRVSFEASKLYGTDIKLYAKTANDDTDITTNPYEELSGELSNDSIPASSSKDEFYSYRFYLKKPEGFANFLVKLVLTGDPSKSDVPRVKNLKTYALYDPDIDTTTSQGII